jgi:SAM-dependent methyltransferase
LLPTLFATTLFVGATLLFLVQPLVGKLLLPLVGGTPGVWNTCMVFFQAALLAGYLYAHRSVARFGVRRQAAFHLGVLALVVVAFKVALVSTNSPVPVAESLLPSDQDYPVFGVVALLAVAVGVPFFVLSTTSPLLQRWFAATGHPSAKDPYFLYAASNAGSLLGLLAYPLLIEPEFTLATQQSAWAAGVVVYLLFVTTCAIVVFRNAERGTRNESNSATGSEIRIPNSAIPNSRIWRWVGLSALPSSLLLGVTTHVTTHLAPVPLLWVVPLALYLVSFILVFAHWPDGVHRFVGRLTPLLLVPVVLTLLMGATGPMALVGGLHMLAFFGVCVVCHGELAKDRPPTEHLTRFYFWMSVGGVIGGTVNALIGPLVFKQIGMVEYPLALALAALVRPRREEGSSRLRLADLAWVGALFAVSLSLVLIVPRYVKLPVELTSPETVYAWLSRSALMFGAPALLAYLLMRKPARYALALAAIMLAAAFDPGANGDTLHKERNFFGVLRVTKSPDGKYIQLVHGTAVFGRQRADEPDPPRPMSGYHEDGPVGHLFESIPPHKVKEVAVVGLGTGAVAAYAKPGQKWVFYELDPSIDRIAKNPAYFRYLSTCKAAGVDVVLGDARRQLMRADDAKFDLILLDAFSSDSIPVHLLTREAIQLYMKKLTPGGVLALHVSNDHLDLPPLVARLAADHNPPLAVRACHDIATELEKADGKTNSRWMVLARTEAILEPLEPVPAPRPRGGKTLDWKTVPATDGPVWRDDFANLLKVWKKSE